ncbi:MAG: mechanosensitive ion channel [Victivallaceae bacterium]
MGLALAFSAKDMLANFFGSIVIVMDKPFQVGDRIKIDDCNGIVTQVGIRSTRILTEDEDVYTIPNSIFTSNKVINISSKGKIKYIFSATLTYSTSADDMQKAVDLLHEIVDDFHGKDMPEYQPRIFFSSLGNWSMNIKVIMWLKSSDFKVIEEWVNEINFAIVRQFNANKLNMAFPTSTNYLLSDPANPVVVAMMSPEAQIIDKQ